MIPCASEMAARKPHDKNRKTVMFLTALPPMKSFLFRILLVAVFSLAGTTVLMAHKDAIIQLNGTSLTGLPKNYAPAELDMTAFRLRIGNRQMSFSPLLRS